MQSAQLKLINRAIFAYIKIKRNAERLIAKIGISDIPPLYIGKVERINKTILSTILKN